MAGIRRSRTAMPLDPALRERVETALVASGFAANGAVITDLDGTAVHQVADIVEIARTVQHGLERVRECGRPIVIDTLRFPLSVMRTFGRQWARWINRPLPCVTLNGSLIGDIVPSGGDLAFTERAAFPLDIADLEEVISGIDKALAAGVDRFTLFAYPREAAAGELIWTPRAERIREIRAKYVSASEVWSSDIGNLRRRLCEREICMLALQTEDVGDTRLAFQHVDASGFITRAGIDKLSGARWLCDRLGVDHASSLAAGDTKFDTFLDGAGLAVHVGTLDLAFRGVHDTVRLPDPLAFGEVLAEVVSHCRARLR